MPSPGCLDGGDAARIATIGDELDLGLADGRRVLLPGLDPVRAGKDLAIARRELERWLLGRTVAVRPLAPEPDRWGRTVALVFAPSADDGKAVSVAEALLDAGFARARPDPAVATCWAPFLRLESAARGAGRGLWADPAFAVIDAGNRAGLAARMGTMAIVSGRIGRVRPGRARTYLPFTTDFNGFTATVERRVAARWATTGIDIAAWAGRTVRVRGFLDDRFGTQIELLTPDQVEFIEP